MLTYFKIAAYCHKITLFSKEYRRNPHRKKCYLVRAVFCLFFTELYASYVLAVFMPAVMSCSSGLYHLENLPVRYYEMRLMEYTKHYIAV